jgi:hypothetical protein
VTFTVCSAEDGGAPDADAGGADAGQCFASCDEACEALKPSTLSGRLGVCLSTDAGASGEMVTVSCQGVVQCTGRKLEGLEAPTGDVHWLGRAAWLEAASVHAFERLARELAAHDAPAELVSAARRCARDERRHAKVMTRLARKRGAHVPAVVVEDVPVRDLESIARENAVEGCVGETLGALHAEWLAERGDDAELATAMRAIAPDELRHAALGWAIAEWAEAKLDAAQRQRVRAARDAAARELVDRARTEDERVMSTMLFRQLGSAA